ncbi:MAG: type IV secretion system DNA-binding domain-containing protein [Metallibacterium scheffleri]
MKQYKYITVHAGEVILGSLLAALAGLASVSVVCIYIAGPFHGGWHALMKLPSEANIVHRILHWIALLAPLAGAGWGGWLFARQEAEQHSRGPRYYRDLQQAGDVLHKIEVERMSAAQRADKVRGIVLGGVELSRRREAEHIVMLGLPGGGKTTGVIYPVLDQALARGDRVITHDAKGDLTAARYDESTSVLLGPWDDRAATWDVGADFFDPALVDEFASTLCGADEKTAGKNLSFHQGAALLIGGLIKSAMAADSAWSWATLADALAQPPRVLIQQAAKGDPLVMQALPTAFTNPDQDAPLSTGEGAMLSILGSASRMVVQLAAVQRAKPQARLFSIRRWLLGEADLDIRLVLLNNNAQYSKASRAIFGSMLHVVAALSSSAVMPEKPADADALWMILDEGRLLGPEGLRAVDTIAAVGRSRGVRVLLGLQDAEQLAAEVGRDQAGPMLSMQGLRLYLRAAPESAENIARTIGEREIQRIQSTASSGAVHGKTSTYDRVPVCLPSDFTGLGVRHVAAGMLDIEMIAQADDVLCLLVQRVNPRNYRPITDAMVPSAAWSRGTLQVPSAPAPRHAPSPSPSLDIDPDADAPARTTDTDDDNPDDFGNLIAGSHTPEPNGPSLEYVT